MRPPRPPGDRIRVRQAVARAKADQFHFRFLHQFLGEFDGKRARHRNLEPVFARIAGAGEENLVPFV